MKRSYHKHIPYHNPINYNIKRSYYVNYGTIQLYNIKLNYKHIPYHKHTQFYFQISLQA